MVCSSTAFVSGPSFAARAVRSGLSALVLCGLALAALPAAHAQNVVLNGDFESPALAGDGVIYSTDSAFSLPGWTYSTGGNQVYLEHGKPFNVARYYSGRQALSLNGDGAPVFLSQNLNTVAGQAYQFSFALNEENVFHTNSATAVRVDLGALSQNFTLGAQTGLNGYVVYSLLYTATSASTTLTFTDITPSSASGDSPFLDAVSLTRINAAAVPEPGSVALFVGVGVTAAGFLRRRKRRAAC